MRINNFFLIIRKYLSANFGKLYGDSSLFFLCFSQGTDLYFWGTVLYTVGTDLYFLSQKSIIPLKIGFYIRKL